MHINENRIFFLSFPSPSCSLNTGINIKYQILGIDCVHVMSKKKDSNTNCIKYIVDR